MQLHILAGGLLNQTMMTFSCKRIRNKKRGERRAPFLQSQETFAIYSKLLAKLRVRGFLHGLPGLQRLQPGIFYYLSRDQKSRARSKRDGLGTAENMTPSGNRHNEVTRENISLRGGKRHESYSCTLWLYLPKMFSKVSKGSERFSKVQEGFKRFWNASQVTFLNLSQPFETLQNLLAPKNISSEKSVGSLNLTELWNLLPVRTHLKQYRNQCWLETLNLSDKIASLTRCLSPMRRQRAFT